MTNNYYISANIKIIILEPWNWHEILNFFLCMQLCKVYVNELKHQHSRYKCIINITIIIIIINVLL